MVTSTGRLLWDRARVKKWRAAVRSRCPEARTSMTAETADFTNATVPSYGWFRIWDVEVTVGHRHRRPAV